MSNQHDTDTSCAARWQYNVREKQVNLIAADDATYPLLPDHLGFIPTAAAR